MDFESLSHRPITIIVSKSEGQVVVMRNGVEIGRSIADVNGDDPGSHVVTLTKAADGTPRSVYIGRPVVRRRLGRGGRRAPPATARLP